MTWLIPEADQCLVAAKSSGCIIQIGLQWQSSGSLVDARKWIQNGLVGKVTQVQSWMCRNTPHGKGQWVRPIPADCTAQNVNWSAFLNGRPDRPFDPYRLISATVLGIFGWQRDREHGAPDCVDHEGP